MDRDELMEVEINKGQIKANISSHLDQTNPLHKGFMYELKKQQRRRRLRKRHSTLGRTRKVITPPWYKRGVVGGRPPPPPRGFDMLGYFGRVLPSVESLWSLQDEVYLMSGGAAGDLWRHQTWSPSWILSRIGNQAETVRMNIFLLLTCKITHK